MNVRDRIDTIEANVGLIADLSGHDDRAALERIIGADLDEIRMALGLSIGERCEACSRTWGRGSACGSLSPGVCTGSKSEEKEDVGDTGTVQAKALARHAIHNLFHNRWGVVVLDERSGEVGVYTNLGRVRTDGSEPIHDAIRVSIERGDLPGSTWIGYSPEDERYSAATIIRLGGLDVDLLRRHVLASVVEDSLDRAAESAF